MSEAQFKKNGPRFPESFPSVPVTGRFAEAKISPGYDSLNLERAKAYGTNIDPRVISSLRISTTHFKSVLFKDIPLDPLKFRSISGGDGDSSNQPEPSAASWIARQTKRLARVQPYPGIDRKKY